MDSRLLLVFQISFIINIRVHLLDNSPINMGYFEYFNSLSILIFVADE